MLKIQIYPKTTRVGAERAKYNVYEKLDGSNLSIGKIGNELYIFTRNCMFYENEWDDLPYPNLKNYLVENKDNLLNDLQDNIIIFGEWLGMGKIKYTRYGDDTKGSINRFYMFGYAEFNLSDLYRGTNSISDIKYDSKEYAFNKTASNYTWDERSNIWLDITYIKPVPHLVELDEYYGELLTNLYNRKYYYSALDGESQSEGFIIVDYKQNVLKFVMNKN